MSGVGSKRPRAAAAKAAPKVAGREGFTALPGGEGACTHFVRRAFAHSDASALFRDLKAATDASQWRQQTLTVMGAQHAEPRMVRYQGASASAALSYSYSGVTVTPTPFEPAVLTVLERLRELFPDDGPQRVKLPPFNTCLLNYYRSGDDKLGWHDDTDNKRYGPQPIIASVSFGAERAFQLRSKRDHAQKLEFTLGAGAVLIMAGSCQATWEHSVPARAKAPGERINLTFRHVITDTA